MACRTSKYAYENPPFEGKSYIGKFQNYSTSFHDSTMISGRMFIKGNNEFIVPNSSKLELISVARDTIQIRTSFFDGFEVKLPSGRYKLLVHSDNCVGIEIDNFELKANTLYLIDFYLQKGQGVSKWTL